MGMSTMRRTGKEKVHVGNECARFRVDRAIESFLEMDEGNYITNTILLANEHSFMLVPGQARSIPTGDRATRHASNYMCLHVCTYTSVHMCGVDIEGRRAMVQLVFYFIHSCSHHHPGILPANLAIDFHHPPRPPPLSLFCSKGGVAFFLPLLLPVDVPSWILVACVPRRKDESVMNLEERESPGETHSPTSHLPGESLEEYFGGGEGG